MKEIYQFIQNNSQTIFFFTASQSGAFDAISEEPSRLGDEYVEPMQVPKTSMAHHRHIFYQDPSKRDPPRYTP